MWVATLFVLAIASSADAQQAVVVQTERVRTMDFQEEVTLVGRTEPWIRSRIVAEVSGRVAAINAQEGAQIYSGEPLITLDDEHLRYSLAAKTAEAEQVRLRSELAQSQLKRTRELFDRKLVSQTTLDSALAWVAIQSEQARQVDAERAQFALDLENSEIVAPFTGFTGRRLVDVGEWVNPGTPVFELVDISRARIRVDLPERYFGRVTVGSPVHVTVSERPGVDLVGKVSGISPNASQETHTFPVIVDVDNSEGILGGGMLVRAGLQLDREFRALAVSKDAIVRQGIQTMIYTVVDGKAAPITITTVSSKESMVAIQGDGLTENMEVIVRGNERVYPGAAVRVSALEPETTAPNP